MVLVLGIVKASLEILGIGIGVKKVVLLMSGSYLEYASSTFQHLPPTLPCHVHLRYLRNEFLHECQAQRNPRLGLQLRDFRTIHDITIPGKKFFNRITLRTRRTLCAYL